MTTRLSVFLVMFIVPVADAQTPNAMTPQQQRATADIHEFFRRSTAKIAADNLADVRTLADWQTRRPVLRQQLFDMLGLNPLPERTPLRATVTGTVVNDDIVVEKLHFQSRPGLYVTADFYRPKKVDQPLPTILYVCGHGNVKQGDVSFGSKTAYQHHAVWFAREGYCCLILDTLQLGEIEGIHHGTRRFGMWWWIARGYTPAGVEAWNCIRALDYLETRPEVDAKRIGVTGRSGGGIYTWWTAALDDRPACLVPVAGITDLQNYVVDHAIEGHCDCMFMVNSARWDFSTVAALAAPRPVLFSNSDKDKLFPLDGVYRTHAQLHHIYQLHRATDKLGLLITEGPHQDTQELQVPAFRWFNRWLKKSDASITRLAVKAFTPQQLKVFEKLPADQKNTTIHETFVPLAQIKRPDNTPQWTVCREHLFAALKERCFLNWPANSPALDCISVREKEMNGLKLQAIEFTSEENLRFTVYVVCSAQHPKPTRLILTPVDTEGWTKWTKDMGGLFDGSGPIDDAMAKSLQKNPWAFAVIPPRGEGPNRWDADGRKDTDIRRRFVLVGRTMDDGQVWDTRRALAALKSRSEYAETNCWLKGTGKMAGIALYTGLFEPTVEQFELHQLPTSHRVGPIFINVLRVMDMPQAVALALPRRVNLYGTDAKVWSWPVAIASLDGKEKPLIQVHD